MTVVPHPTQWWLCFKRDSLLSPLSHHWHQVPVLPSCCQLHLQVWSHHVWIVPCMPSIWSSAGCWKIPRSTTDNFKRSLLYTDRQTAECKQQGSKLRKQAAPYSPTITVIIFWLLASFGQWQYHSLPELLEVIHIPYASCMCWSYCI